MLKISAVSTDTIHRHYLSTSRETVVVLVRPPPAPVMVMVWVPVLARVVVLNVRVDVPVPVTDVGLKVAVTPVGRVLVEKATAESNPPATVLVMVEVTELPLTTPTEVGEALSLKVSPAGKVTVRETVVVCTRLPLVPVTVIAYVPVAMVEGTVKVRIELPAPVMGLTLKAAVTPVGMPDAVKVIAESKLFTTALVIVDVPLLPCTTETEVGEAERLKLGVVDTPTRALIRLAPFMLPQPVTKS